MMNQTGEFGYAETDDMQIAEIPYAGDDLSMLVLLPAAGLTKVEAGLPSGRLAALRKSLRKQKVEHKPSDSILFVGRFAGPPAA